MAAHDRFFSDFMKAPNHERGMGLRQGRHLFGKDLRPALDDLSPADRVRNTEFPKPRGCSRTLTPPLSFKELNVPNLRQSGMAVRFLLQEGVQRLDHRR